MTTGQRIKSMRKKAGLTQTELAKKLNIPYQSIGQWERDIRTPKQQTLIKIAKALGVHLRDLADTSMWEEFDKQYPNAGIEYAEFEDFKKFLEKNGYIYEQTVTKFHWEEDDTVPTGKIPVEDEFEVTLIKDGHTAIFTQAEFEALQAGAKEAIEGRFYKKVLEQQKKK